MRKFNRLFILLVIELFFICSYYLFYFKPVITVASSSLIVLLQLAIIQILCVVLIKNNRFEGYILAWIINIPVLLSVGLTVDYYRLSENLSFHFLFFNLIFIFLIMAIFYELIKRQGRGKNSQGDGEVNKMMLPR